jgi:transglutaminase-like putative cysteine protease
VKKLVSVIIIMATVFGFGMSVQASSNRDPIWAALGEDYTISTTEMTKPMWAYYEGEIVRWQMVEPSRPLNMRRFTRNDNFPYSPFGGLWTTQTGDVKVATHHDGQQWLLVDIGPDPRAEHDWIRAYHAVRINIELNPTETVCWVELNTYIYPWELDEPPCVIEWNTEKFSTLSSTNEEFLAHLLLPAPGIESDHPDIIRQAMRIIQSLPVSQRNDERAITRAIHLWVASNVAYDMDHYGWTSDAEGPRETQTALTVLRERKGVCVGYATLTVALLRASGIPTKIINGMTPECSHVWYHAFVDGQWIMGDSTADSASRFRNGVGSWVTVTKANSFDFPIEKLFGYIIFDRYALYFDLI